MNISDILVQAQKAIDEAKVSDDLREVAFQKAVEILSREAAPIGTASTSPTAIGRSPSAGAAESASAKIARKLGLSPHAIGEIYSDNDQGGVDLVVGVGKLENSTATASKQIALLLSGGRQLAEVEQWTPSREVRRACVHYGRFDPANFAKSLKQMDDAFSFRGKAQQLEVRVHQRGIERLKQVITTLTGGVKK